MLAQHTTLIFQHSSRVVAAAADIADDNIEKSHYILHVSEQLRINMLQKFRTQKTVYKNEILKNWQKRYN